MSRLSLGDIDELAGLQAKILNGSVLIDQLLARERVPAKFAGGTVESLTGRRTLAELLDDITEAAREMAAIVNRDDEGDTK